MKESNKKTAGKSLIQEIDHDGESVGQQVVSDDASTQVFAIPYSIRDCADKERGGTQLTVDMYLPSEVDSASSIRLELVNKKTLQIFHEVKLLTSTRVY